MLKTLLLCAALALLIAGCSTDSPMAADESAQAAPAAKLTVSGDRVGGAREPDRRPLDLAPTAPTLLHELRFDRPLGTGGLEISWLEVSDSRCAEGAVCVWEGEVGVLLGVKEGGEDLGTFSLTVHHPDDERAQARIGNRLLQLVDVAPYPSLDREPEQADYVASLAISRELERRPLPGGLIDSERPAGGLHTGQPLPEPGGIDPEPGEKPDYTTLEAALDENRTKWKTAAAQRYQFRFQRSCFCLPDYTRAVHLTVNDSRVEAAEFADTNEAVDPEHFGRYETVEALFELIAEAIEGGAARIDAEFDGELGYPVNLYIDRHLMMADEEQGFEAGELVILE